MGSLPPEWKVSWVADEAVAAKKGALDLTVLPAGATSLSLAFLEDDLGVWERSTFPVGAVAIQLRRFPTFDEVWCLWMLAAREKGKPRHDAWESVARYVDQVRQGLWPDRRSPEAAPQALYLALAQERLEADPPDPAKFLDEALALCDALAKAVERGGRIGEDDLLRDEAWLAHYRTFLDSDHKVYRRDRQHGTPYRATVPATPQQPARRLPLLVLRRPTSRLFKFWARTDLEAPGGDGYALLLVELEAGRVVLSADPTSRIDLSWCAHALNLVEEKRAPGPPDDPWYDGARHKRTLVAAPKRGTALEFDTIVGVLRRELRLRRIHDRRLVRTVGIAAAAVAMVAIVFIVVRIARGSKVDHEAIAKEAHDAIYLMAYGDPDGPPSSACTTFAVGAHTLATARHCLEGFPRDLSRTRYFVIQNEDPEVRRIRLKRAVLHRSVDVAIICVDGLLPKLLHLAANPEELTNGSEVAIYGFPGVTATETASASNQSRLYSAHFMSTMVSRLRQEGDAQVIEYTAPGYSGVSGAPVLDEHGRVVAVHRGMWNFKTGEAPMLSFGERADALKSLLATDPCGSD